MHKGFVVYVVVFLSVMLAVPALVTYFDASTAPHPKKPIRLTHDAHEPMIRVFLTKERRVVAIPLESYIRGVVAAEMPADFHLEALKAQAMAARTYIAERLAKGDFTDMRSYGAAAEDAQVTDSPDHQAFMTDEQLKMEWKDRYPSYSNRVNQAVQETRGKILLYGGKPIYAAFFSTSNGQTENAEDYFRQSYPYLRSVPSPWDRQSPKYQAQIRIAMSEVVHRLESFTGKKLIAQSLSGAKWISGAERTKSDRIRRIRIGDQWFTGRQVREALGLPSTDFTWSIRGGTILFITQGYGHGVGMSQWGANLLAKQGRSAVEIVQYYYRGVTIGHWP
ncbi:stage II sporulation protein D [Polycladomyces abyssicola]|uniref:Stage II sporulation protein D n=1 Tax=Polycladomyces abyssicola TaxID=1125966 RepID=A0A8D5UIU9_9BACL|nr:stage II sporulation protein D [Polycladomyces abyssicola]BCU83241.1 stage II sporulation protein D [Polycladomyces abyssicola]